MTSEPDEDRAQVGSYMPRTFSIRLLHPAIGKQPQNGPLYIPRAAFPTLMHEFGHLVQDWSTFRGVIDFLNLWDQVGAISDLAGRSGADIPFPVVGAGGVQRRLRPETLYALDLDDMHEVTEPRHRWKDGKPSWRYLRREIEIKPVWLAGRMIDSPFVWVYLLDEATGKEIKHRLGAWEIKEAYSVAVGALHGAKPKVAGKVGFEYLIVDRVLTHHFDGIIPLHTIALGHWTLQDLAPGNTLFALIEQLAASGRNLPSPVNIYQMGRAEAFGRDFERNSREIIQSVEATAAHHASYGNETLARHLGWYRRHAERLLHLHLDPQRRFPMDTFLCEDSRALSEAECNQRLVPLFGEVELPLLFMPDGSTHSFSADPETESEAFFIQCVVDLFRHVWRRTDDSWPCLVYDSCNLPMKDTTECKSQPWKKAWQHPTCAYGAAARLFGIAPGKSIRLTLFPSP